MKKISTTISIIVFVIGFSQNDQGNPLNTFTRINLGLHGLELTHELPLSYSFLWENSVGIGMGAYVSNMPNYTFVLDSPVPYVTSELKYMYNRQKRTNKGRSTKNNSGNYIGFQAKYSFGNSGFFNLNQTLLTEVHWGIQRPLGNRFIFDLHLGLGYIVDFNTKEDLATPTFGLRFGYILFPPK